MKSKALLLVVVLSQMTCHQVIFHAPPGTDVTCFANPGFISAFNGVSVISCILIEDVGTPVADGTVVQFFTTLGRIPEQARTNDGVVRVNLEADGRSGPADITVVSGGEAVAPSSSVTTSSTLLPGRSSSAALSASALAGVGALQNSFTLTVQIGNVNAAQLTLTAFPNRITDSRSTQLTASVFDGNGNPVGGVPVFFEVGDATTLPGPTPSPGTPTPSPSPSTTPVPGAGLEHVDSQGQPVYTDTNGQAHDVLRTRYPRDAPQRSVTVRAFVPRGSVADTVTVIIN
jgi:hypothetical protein